MEFARTGNKVGGDMMALYEFEGRRPRISGKNTFVHPQAVIIGDVEIGDNCNILPGVVLRGDYGRIVVGSGSNLQDGVIVHTEPGTEAILGENSHVGHGAMLHGPLKMGNGVLIGIHAVVLNGCEIGDGAVIGAMSLLTNNTRVGPRKMMMGVPAREVKDVSDDLASYVNLGIRLYQDLAVRYSKGLKLIEE